MISGSLGGGGVEVQEKFWRERKIIYRVDNLNDEICSGFYITQCTGHFFSHTKTLYFSDFISIFREKELHRKYVVYTFFLNFYIINKIDLRYLFL